MEIKILPAFSYKPQIEKLFGEYTDILRKSDPQFDSYLKFQNYDDELLHLEHKYAPPFGRLYIALHNEKAVGCIGLKKLDETLCEMKRLYVIPEYRKNHIAEMLVNKIFEDARQIGYKTMYLDTLPALAAAVKLYEKTGFTLIEKYNDSPVDNAIYMKKEL